MADFGSNTAIVVALIAVSGTLGAAYINTRKPDITAPAPIPTVTIPNVQEPAAGATALPTPAAPETVAAAPSLPVEPKRDLSGVWAESQTGALYSLTQNGTILTAKGRFGDLSIDATGTTDGTLINWSFAANSGDAGSCMGKATSPERIALDCVNTLGPYAIVLNKQPA